MTDLERVVDEIIGAATIIVSLIADPSPTSEMWSASERAAVSLATACHELKKLRAKPRVSDEEASRLAAALNAEPSFASMWRAAGRLGYKRQLMLSYFSQHNPAGFECPCDICERKRSSE